MAANKLLKTSSSSKIIISISIIGIISLASYSWIVSPQTCNLHAVQQQQLMRSSTGQKTTMIKDKVQSKEVELAELYKEIAMTKDSFFSHKKAKEFFVDLEPLSLQCGCTIDSLMFMPSESVESKEQNGQKSSVTLEKAKIQLTGQYDNITKFLRKLSGYSERITLSRFFMEPIGPRNRELFAEMHMTIYLIEDKETIDNE